jgi:type II secretory pathway pseudopilin PulG
MGAYFRLRKQGLRGKGVGRLPSRGFTIIEVMLFFAVTGALMLGVLGTASIGVNTQRYNDAVNTFTAIVQQEFTNVTNVVNTKSNTTMCTSASNTNRGVSGCVILGRLMTIDSDGDMVRSNIISTTTPSAPPAASTRELAVVRSYNPRIDTTTQEDGQMNWGTRVLKNSNGSNVSLLIIRSPRSGNVYSYVVHSNTGVASNVNDLIDDILGGAANNSRDQYMCVDRSGWVASSTRVVKLAP